jgi:hypothetical protein
MGRRSGTVGTALVPLVAVLALGATACAGRRGPASAPPALDQPDSPLIRAVEPPGSPPPAPVPAVEPAPVGTEPVAAQPDETAPAEPGSADEPPPSASATAANGQRRPLRELCRKPEGEGFVDESRRRLEETFCGATLWFDGLFGGEPDLGNARAVSGRVELSTLHTDFDGLDYKGRLRLNYELPNLERRVRFFLGREDEDEFITDRREGFAIRSSVFGLENEEEWLAGLGYSPPGRWLSRTDFRVGGRVKTAPEVFGQWRLRQNVFVGEDTVWRLRETLFWENRDGFGSTSSVDVDRVLRRDLLLRWGSVGTISEVTEGIHWRSAALVYKNLPGTRAVAGELFVRGATDAEVKMREYGTRIIYREPLGRPYLFGEVILGYTWPRTVRDEPREGSTMVGFGLELLFGRDPW